MFILLMPIKFMKFMYHYFHFINEKMGLSDTEQLSDYILGY